MAGQRLKRMQKNVVLSTFLLKKKTSLYEVFSKIANSDEAFGVVHNSCRIKFGTKINSFSQRCGLVSDLKVSTDDPETTVHSDNNTSSPIKRVTRSCSCGNYERLLCFICYEKMDTNKIPCGEGGLGRCSEESTSTAFRIKEQLSKG